MIRITKTSLTVHIEHPCPRDLLREIQQGLIFTLQNQDHTTFENEGLKDAYFFLLLLLKETMWEEKEPGVKKSNL